mgnify:FL=1
MDGLKKFLNNFEGYICIGTLAVMSVVVFIQVFFRYVVKGSLPWSEELSRYLLVWTAFMGGAYGVRQGAHIGVEAFMLLFPKKIQKIVAILVKIGGIILCAVICYYGWRIVGTQIEKNQLSPAMRIPMGYMYAAIPIGMIFFIIRYIQDIIDDVKNFNNDEKKEA